MNNICALNKKLLGKMNDTSTFLMTAYRYCAYLLQNRVTKRKPGKKAVCQVYLGLFDRILDETSNKSFMSRNLYHIAYEDKQNPQVFMVTSVHEILMNSVFTGSCVTDKEANYSHYVIWPLLDAIIVIVNKLKFHCGEYRSRSDDNELGELLFG